MVLFTLSGRIHPGYSSHWSFRLEILVSARKHLLIIAGQTLSKNKLVLLIVLS